MAKRGHNWVRLGPAQPKVRYKKPPLAQSHWRCVNCMAEVVASSLGRNYDIRGLSCDDHLQVAVEDVLFE